MGARGWRRRLAPAVYVSLSATVIGPGIAAGQRGDIVRRRSRVGTRQRVMLSPMPVLCLMAIAACPALMCGA